MTGVQTCALPIFVADLFGGHVSGSAGVGGHPRRFLGQRLGQIEVNEPDVAGLGHEDVLGLEVEVDESLFVQVFEGGGGGDEDVPDELAGHRIVAVDELLEIPADDALEQGVVHAIKIAMAVEADDELMAVDLLQDLAAVEELLPGRFVHGAIAQEPAQGVGLAIRIGSGPNLRRAAPVDELVQRIRPEQVGRIRIMGDGLLFPLKES